MSSRDLSQDTSLGQFLSFQQILPSEDQVLGVWTVKKCNPAILSKSSKLNIRECNKNQKRSHQGQASELIENCFGLSLDLILDLAFIKASCQGYREFLSDFECLCEVKTRTNQNNSAEYSENIVLRNSPPHTNRMLNDNQIILYKRNESKSLEEFGRIFCILYSKKR